MFKRILYYFKGSKALNSYLSSLIASLENASDLTKDKRDSMTNEMQNLINKSSCDDSCSKDSSCDYPDSVKLPKLPTPNEDIPALSKALSIVYDKNQVR